MYLPSYERNGKDREYMTGAITVNWFSETRPLLWHVEAQYPRFRRRGPAGGIHHSCVTAIYPPLALPHTKGAWELTVNLS